jgi:xyloglucan 6-xylosyltransferase
MQMLLQRLVPPSSKGRRILKVLDNMKITVMCGLMTVLVMRGTIGTGTFGTSPDAQEETESADHHHRIRILNQLEDEENLTTPWDGLGPVVSDWDAQRRQYWKLNQNSNVSGGLPAGTVSELLGLQPQKLQLVTAARSGRTQGADCVTRVADHYLLKFFKNKIDYCRLHNIEFFYNTADLDRHLTGFWTKLPLLRNMMLAHPEVEWLWWMDTDAVITDMLFELPLEKYQNYSLVVQGFPEAVYRNKSWTGLNTGSFLIRNCQWSLDLLDAWAPMGPKGSTREKAGEMLTQSLVGRPASLEADDQSALVYLLITQTAKWADRVYLESTYFLHGYWVELVEKYEKMMENFHPGLGDERWPLVTHFTGCKPCPQFSDFPVERCLKQMERAFNFANNQVLHIYGYQHNSLEKGDVKPKSDTTATTTTT